MGLFVFKYLLNLKNVSHYTGSMLAYEEDPRILSKWDYEDPRELRDNYYLSQMGGQRHKTLGFHGINFIDLREPGVYTAGHPEYTINIPYSVFKAHWGKWDAFAKLIGPMGVNRDYEAVVWGYGLSKESALAYFMLKFMGQTKTGIGYSSVENWKEIGQKMTERPTVVRAPEVPWDLALNPTDYKALGQLGMIADLEKKPVFPRIFVDSGEKASTTIKVPGEARHVPYTGAAKGEIGMLDWVKVYWHFKKDNNLPKLAEIVCFADDPAEAAFNWFALKQAGYPNVTILMP